jgi:hypothetical protein
MNEGGFGGAESSFANRNFRESAFCNVEIGSGRRDDAFDNIMDRNGLLLLKPY